MNNSMTSKESTEVINRCLGCPDMPKGGYCGQASGCTLSTMDRAAKLIPIHEVPMGSDTCGQVRREETIGLQSIS